MSKDEFAKSEIIEILKDSILELREKALKIEKEIKKYETFFSKELDKKLPPIWDNYVLRILTKNELQKDTDALRSKVLGDILAEIKQKKKMLQELQGISAKPPCPASGKKINMEDVRAVPFSVVFEHITGQKNQNKYGSAPFICPFHTEKTPSFTIFKKNNRAKCFGCGWYGDSIKFVIEYEKISFLAALDRIPRLW